MLDVRCLMFDVRFLIAYYNNPRGVRVDYCMMFNLLLFVLQRMQQGVSLAHRLAQVDKN